MIGIVVGAVVFLVALGGIIMALSHRDDASTISSTRGTPSAQPPGHRPSSDPSTNPSGESSPSSGGSSGKSVSVGNCAVTPASGWKVVKHEKSSNVVLANSHGDHFNVQCPKFGSDTKPSQVLREWLDQLAEDFNDTQKKSPESVNIGDDTLKAATAQMKATSSGSQGSETVWFTSAAMVRDNGQGGLATLEYDSSSDTDQLQQDWSAMVSSLARSV